MTYTEAHHTDALRFAPAVNRDAKRDGGISVYLTRAQDDRCFDCGKVRPLEFAHFVKAGNGRAYVKADGTLGVVGAMACRDCNLLHHAICTELGTDSNLPVAYLLADGRAERIVTDLPNRAALVALHTETVNRATTATREAAWEAITRLGL